DARRLWKASCAGSHDRPFFLVQRIGPGYAWRAAPTPIDEVSAMRNFSALLALLLFSLAAVPLQSGPHPFHDDGGSVNWRPNLAPALKAAQAAGKPVFIEAGREG